MALLGMCGLKSAIQNCSAATAAFHIKDSLANGIHDVIMVLQVGKLNC